MKQETTKNPQKESEVNEKGNKPLKTLKSFIILKLLILAILTYVTLQINSVGFYISSIIIAVTLGFDIGVIFTTKRVNEIIKRADRLINLQKSTINKLSESHENIFRYLDEMTEQNDQDK